MIRAFTTRSGSSAFLARTAGKMETINKLVMTAQGPATMNDMTTGRYDVNVSVGPSYSARREETRDGVQALLQAVPGAAQVIGDLYVSTLEWEHADRAAERMRKMLPPGIAEDPKRT